MTDDRQPPPVVDALAVFGAIAAVRDVLDTRIEQLRDDVREDLGHLRDDNREDNARLEGRLMAVIAEVRADHVEFAVAHAGVHEVMEQRSTIAHARFDEYIELAKLDKARRDGALGLVRYVVDLLGRYARPLTAILFGIASIILAASGAIQIQVGSL